jgi:signal transduction histidine kinase
VKSLSLTRRLSLVFALLLIACSGVSVWLQISASNRHEQVVVQQLSTGLAGHIAETAQLMDVDGWRPDAVRGLFDKLMAVNPAVEVYLLARDGRIVGNAAPPGKVQLERVNLAPITRYLSGAQLPILGDDPRNPQAQKVFSAAPVTVNGREGGYVYVVLQGEARDALVAALSTDSVLRATLWAMALMGLFSLIMGLIAFRLITRPLRDLTQAVGNFDPHGEAAAALGDDRREVVHRDEIDTLRTAFAQMGQRITAQWRELSTQDQQRRDMVANISHDLRTPLTSLHGYLETLRVKDHSLTPEERRHYLDIALGQSSKVGRLAQELFELARLESGLVHPELEPFALPDLVQDVMQKFELAAQARQQRLSVEMPPALPAVRADLGMIERVLTNLLDNAIRHNPAGTHILVRMQAQLPMVQVEVADSGQGLPPQVRKGLFTRASALQRVPGASGGLGLIIVQRMLQLHGSEVCLVEAVQPGTVFRFHLQAA